MHLLAPYGEWILVRGLGCLQSVCRMQHNYPLTAVVYVLQNMRRRNADYFTSKHAAIAWRNDHTYFPA